MRTVAAITAHELRTLRHDPGPVIVLVAMPLVAIAFITPLYQAVLSAEGFRGATGAEQSVPGMAAMFGFFLAGFIGFAFFREHGYGTWSRLRASPASGLQIVAGKLAVPLGLALVQQALLFGAGALVFGLHVRGAVVALALMAAAFSLCLVTYGVALVSICRTINQLNMFDNLGAMVFAALGGALLPVAALPAWARPVAPVTPTYWAMRGFRAVILEAGGVEAVALPVVVLLAFAGLFIAVSLLRFRFDDAKIVW